MTKENAKKYFRCLGCSDNFNRANKRCAFYWWEQDYWGECDEGCYLAQTNCRTKIFCYLPYFLQKIILKIMQHREDKRFERLYKNECEEGEVMKLLFGDIVVVEDNLIGVVVKSWGGSLQRKEPNHDVYVRYHNCIKNYPESEIERYMVRHKYLNDEEMEYQREATQ